MNNQAFICYAAEKKQKKLQAILHECTKGILSGDMLQNLLCNISEDQQYEIFVQTDPQSFCETLMLYQSKEKTDCDQLAFDGSVVTRVLEYQSDHIARHAICIYIPAELYNKRMEKVYE